MFPSINIGPAVLPVPALTIILAIYVGLEIAERHANRYRVHPETLYNLAFNALVAGVVGARISFILQNLPAFTENPRSIISINFGLFDPTGGAVIALVVAFFYAQKKQLPIWSVLDALTPTFAIYMIGLAFANLAGGTAYGAETTLPWALDLWGAQRHPAQIYELLGASLILWLLWPTRQLKDENPGVAFMQFVVYTALARLFFEGFRGNSLVLFANIRAAQVGAWLVLAIGMYYLNERYHIIKEYKKKNLAKKQAKKN